ncbi:hypothetical protein [Rufibacter sp. LB8]|uniref:hypothetical protein n=1 Tax=Rufibacter sp. LB8 TaxID=2777781 RepID=UPI00178C3F8F|nr:hypothetical protein [Rufibacter sp. LB8]
MTLYLLRVALLLLFIVLSAQGIFYLFAVKEAFTIISIEAFIEQRKAVDLIIGSRLKVIYFLALLLVLVVLALASKNYGSLVFITTAISCVCLLTDMGFALKISVPLNQLMATFNPDNQQVDWESLRVEWLFYIAVRGWIMIVGLLTLLAGFLLQNKPTLP